MQTWVEHDMKACAPSPSLCHLLSHDLVLSSEALLPSEGLGAEPSCGHGYRPCRQTAWLRTSALPVSSCGPWASYLACLELSFLICEMARVLTPTSYGLGENLVR